MVALARCKACAGLALFYAALVHDELWQYWCSIADAERELLVEEDDLGSPRRPGHARALLFSHGYLLLGPAQEFEWVPPGHAVIEGTPW
jgi:hypothetical protein